MGKDPEKELSVFRVRWNKNRIQRPGSMGISSFVSANSPEEAKDFVEENMDHFVGFPVEEETVESIEIHNAGDN